MSRKLILGKSEEKLSKSSRSSILLYQRGAHSAVSFVWFLHSWRRSDPVKGLVSFILKVELINKLGGGKKNKQRVKSVLVSAFSVWEVSHPSATVQVLKEAEYLELALLRVWNCGVEHSLETVSDASWEQSGTEESSCAFSSRATSEESHSFPGCSLLFLCCGKGWFSNPCSCAVSDGVKSPVSKVEVECLEIKN